MTFAGALSERLRAARIELVSRWLERITARVSVSPQRVFPTEELLNHVPLLIDGIADYLADPGEELDAEVPVAAKARELGALRHSQGFDAYQILKEYELLGAIVFTHLAGVVDQISDLGSHRDVAEAWQRIAHAIELIRQATMTHFLRLSAERVVEREDRLRRFNRMVSHELKNRVGAIRGSSALLRETWVSADQRERFLTMIDENTAGLQRVLADLEVISRIDGDSRQRRNVLLPQAVAEAARQVRERAQTRGIDIRVADALPKVEVDAAGVELCLANYLSNAIKYADPQKSDRWVSVTAEYSGLEATGELAVRVQDNGIGIPPEGRGRLFQQFYRAHDTTVTDVDGTGLGLNIVRETAESLGGRAWAEYPDAGGVVFAFSLPSRRASDAAAAGTRRLESGEA